MRHGKYTVVSGKYVHSSRLSYARAMLVAKHVMAALIVATMGYMASVCA